MKNIGDLKFLGKNNSDYEFSNYFCTILTKERDSLARYLLENEVYSSYRYWPVHKMNIFKNSCINRDYPNANYMANQALNIPIHDALTDDEVVKVIQLIKEFYKY